MPFHRLAASLAMIVAVSACSDTGVEPAGTQTGVTIAVKDPIRVAVFNASLYRDEPGALARDLAGGENPQALAIAEIIQRVDPDILLINEFDYDAGGNALSLFREQYLAASQGTAAAIHFTDSFIAPSNTGIDSGFDLDKDSTLGGPADAWGFGRHPGQYGMAILSKYDIDEDAVRSFQKFRWADMPDNLIPRPFYDGEVAAALRLSSKTHIDVPIIVGGETIHILASHPTPPGFDGEEDRNGRRNYDEIRMFADYITPGAASYLYDDNGIYGGLAKGARFVIMGDLNADPADGGSRPGAIGQLLDNPLVDTRFTPGSEGACEAAQAQGGVNIDHQTPCRTDTADFDERFTGNLRVDYVLPSVSGLRIKDGGVFWPHSSDRLSRLTGTAENPRPSSDHHLVWLDLHIVP
ncbi:endonuclease/exonuclease/phosphatase family protein [Pacificimonas sp. WHA3]|uniref:Endonuclease/exonuclease/phosphatase family protein n=1 Tax=Pacificimonas pallii TaxID=2827236 RepID=A0ABS6SFN2_9SPHN|nr:endonuclease/exonuclease/phosphatase family protein [Pacificimonas pallii]MBV7257185.1 endonuclease/exonuclease/phosphatase family protein [Pacificimonas pallii]